MKDTYQKSITRAELNYKLGKFVSVEQIMARNGRGRLKNQLVNHYENGTTLTSYGTLIAANIGTELFLTPYHDYSETTSFHCRRYCGLSLVLRRQGLESGEITYID